MKLANSPIGLFYDMGACSRLVTHLSIWRHVGVQGHQPRRAKRAAAGGGHGRAKAIVAGVPGGSGQGGEARGMREECHGQRVVRQGGHHHILQVGGVDRWTRMFILRWH